jgi:hypothetical protein
MACFDRDGAAMVQCLSIRRRRAGAPVRVERSPAGPGMSSARYRRRTVDAVCSALYMAVILYVQYPKHVWVAPTGAHGGSVGVAELRVDFRQQPLRILSLTCSSCTPAPSCTNPHPADLHRPWSSPCNLGSDLCTPTTLRDRRSPDGTRLSIAFSAVPRALVLLFFLQQNNCFDDKGVDGENGGTPGRLGAPRASRATPDQDVL